jgi:probable phosphoglycerate mutase
MMRRTLLLVRHGQTADNASHVFQGQGGRGLNEEGRRQARQLADRLRTVGVDRVVTSDLERAAETAGILGDALSLEIERDEELREVNVGAWTGLSYTEVAERFPEEWAAWGAGVDIRRGGGETYAELAVRITGALDRIAVASDAETILVVSHGAALRSFVCRMLGLPPQGTRVLAGMVNTAITTITLDEHGMRLMSWNDSAHLGD